MAQNSDSIESPNSGIADTVRVGLFGMPRVIAGTSQLDVPGADLQSVLASLIEAVPAMRAQVMQPDGLWLNRGYVFVVNGTFTSDPERRVSPADELLLVSRASGG
jgi:molybdopterin converting factor small subunit